MNTSNRYSILFWIICLMPCAVMADAFSGSWTGTMSDGNDSYPVEALFSQEGYPIFSYTNNNNITREVELRSPGQKIQYVPNGGGVQTYFIDNITKDSERLVYVIRDNFQRTANGYLSDDSQVTVVEYVLQGTELQLTTVAQTKSYTGDSEGNMGGSPTQTISKGVLHRIE